MFVELEQFFSQFDDYVDLGEQVLVEICNVLAHIAAWLIYLIQKLHFILDYFNDLVNLRPMIRNQLLFFLENLLNYFFVVIAETLGVVLLF